MEIIEYDAVFPPLRRSRFFWDEDEDKEEEQEVEEVEKEKEEQENGEITTSP